MTYWVKYLTLFVCFFVHFSLSILLFIDHLFFFSSFYLSSFLGFLSHCLNFGYLLVKFLFFLQWLFMFVICHIYCRLNFLLLHLNEGLLVLLEMLKLSKGKFGLEILLSSFNNLVLSFHLLDLELMGFRDGLICQFLHFSQFLFFLGFSFPQLLESNFILLEYFQLFLLLLILLHEWLLSLLFGILFEIGLYHSFLCIKSHLLGIFFGLLSSFSLSKSLILSLFS